MTASLENPIESTDNVLRKFSEVIKNKLPQTQKFLLID